MVVISYIEAEGVDPRTINVFDQEDLDKWLANLGIQSLRPGADNAPEVGSFGLLVQIANTTEPGETVRCYPGPNIAGGTVARLHADAPAHRPSKLKLEVLVEEELTEGAIRLRESIFVFVHDLISPLASVPQLDPFMPSSTNGLFASLVCSDFDVPKIPGIEANRPSLLLQGLEKLNYEDTKEKPAYKYIDRIKEGKDGPGSLYGTSGAGKTRSVLEYLSHNYGIFISVKEDPYLPAEPDPGSGETWNLLKDLPIAESVAISVKNIEQVANRLKVLILCRHMVFKALQERFGADNLNPYHWLLLQLYPKHFFGGNDIFHELLKRYQKQPPDDIAALFGETKFEWISAIVVDESQVLLRHDSQLFRSQSEATEFRSSFSGVFKSLLEVRLASYKTCVPFAVFSGTGMSMNGLDKETNSGMAKFQYLDFRHTSFTSYLPLEPKSVEIYLSRFLDFKGVSEGVKEHLCKWLRGRPRFAATFLEEFLVCQERTTWTNQTMGIFSPNEKNVIQALDRYIHDMTREDRRGSWQAGNRTPYAALQTFEKQRTRTQLNEIEQAICRYALGGKSEVLRQDAAVLIRVGVAALNTRETNLKTNTVVATMDEPLVVEAGIRYYDVDRVIYRMFQVQEDDGHGDGFEKVCVRPIQKSLMNALKQEFSDGGFSDFKISQKSAYGVISKCCKGQSNDNVADTLKWLKAARGATFDGAVPPFCFADDLFGPDIVCLMWNDEYKKCRFVICQSKYREEQSQAKALATLVPDLIYKKNRLKAGKTPTLVSQLSTENGNELPALWDPIAKEMQSNPLIRVLIEYPVMATATSKSKAGVPKTSSSAATTRNAGSTQTDWLYTIHAGNATDFFSGEVLKLLNHRKGRSLDSHENASMKKQRKG